MGAARPCPCITHRKDMERVIAAARSQGWRAEKSRGGQWRLRHPDGLTTIYAAATPGSASSVAKTVALLRRHGFEWKGR